MSYRLADESMVESAHAGPLACRKVVVDFFAPTSTPSYRAPSRCHKYKGSAFVPEPGSPLDLQPSGTPSTRISYEEAAEQIGRNVAYVAYLHSIGRISGDKHKKTVSSSSLTAYIEGKKLNSQPRRVR
jgi:hypothetical protein